MNIEHHLSRRERQIMDVLHTKESATAAEVRAALPDAPGYPPFAHCCGFWRKRDIRHREEGARLFFCPRLEGGCQPFRLETGCLHFFSGSVTHRHGRRLLENADTELTDSELNKLQQIIKQQKKEGR